MTTISLVATDQLLNIALQPKVASGNQNSVELHVDFDSAWDGYGKSAVFFTERSKTVYEMPMIAGNCEIPHEVLEKAGTLYIGIRGVNSNDNAIKTSSLVKYKIAEGAPAGDGTTVEPTADVYQQILTALEAEHARVDSLLCSKNKSTAGLIYPLATENIPEGFLLCNGAAYSRTEYAELFKAIGTVYGAGNGTTTFNVPNLATRVPIGAGGDYDLGDVGGEAEHVLTVEEMPTHSHRGSVRKEMDGHIAGSYSDVRRLYEADSQLEDLVEETGGGQPHNNMQPYTVVNYIISTGKEVEFAVAGSIVSNFISIDGDAFNQYLDDERLNAGSMYLLTSDASRLELKKGDIVLATSESAFSRQLNIVGESGKDGASIIPVESITFDNMHSTLALVEGNLYLITDDGTPIGLHKGDILLATSANTYEFQMNIIGTDGKSATATIENNILIVI